MSGIKGGPPTGHYMYPNRDWKEEILGRGLGASGARQVADRLSKVEYDTYVEPFLGRGDITRAVAPRGRVILSDLDCHRVVQAKRSLCAPGRTSSACSLVKGPATSCGIDWKDQLKHDSPSTLFVLDPPWEGATARGMRYDRNTAIPAGEVYRETRGLKGTVAVVYGDYPKARREICRPPFECHRIHKNFFGRPFTQLLAVKPAGAS